LESAGGMLYDKLSVRFEGRNGSVGNNIYPFEIGEFKYRQWLDSYFLSFISCGFFLAVLACVFFLISSVIGFIAHYKFNEKTKDKNKFSCCLAATCSGLDLVFVLIAVVTLGVSNMVKENIDSKDEKAKYNILVNQVEQLYSKIANAQSKMDNTIEDALHWASEVNAQLPYAKTIRKVL